jgi:hypothetical protein
MLSVAVRFIAIAFLTLLLDTRAAAAQVYTGSGSIHEVFVGTENENYLRYIDLIDTASSQSWTIRPLSPPQVTELFRIVPGTAWATRLARSAATSDPITAGFLSSNVSSRANTAYPYGSNDAAIWTGRGLTLSAQAGAFAQMGPVSISLAPIVFRTSNAAFPSPLPTLACSCGDPLYGPYVDRPQRFGKDAYGRLDPGQSSIRVDLLHLNAGVSTANEGWGPSVEYPFLLGNNAPGFPHVFFGTAAPLPVFVGALHLRVIYGRLDQSNYSPIGGSKYYFSRLEPGRLRFASGLIMAFQPRGFAGLEIGGARFVHSIWPRSGIPASYFKKPLQAFLKINLPGIDRTIAGTDNQLASLFARWAFRQSGLEVYGEYGREDNSYDLRDFMQEPDHQRAYSLGLAKILNQSPSSFSALRIELMNFQLPSLATTTRGEGSIYIHGTLRQGHTNRGQLLGADAGVGAAGASTVRWDHYTSAGRWAVFWRRNLRKEESDPSLEFPNGEQISDVLHAFGYERVKFTRRFDVTTAVTFMRDLSRDFSNSRSNLYLVLSLTLPR